MRNKVVKVKVIKCLFNANWYLCLWKSGKKDYHSIHFAFLFTAAENPPHDLQITAYKNNHLVMYIDTAKLYVQFLDQNDAKFKYCTNAIMSCWWFCKRLRVVACKSLKTQVKSSWVISKVVAVAYVSGCLQELFITKFKLQFTQGFTKVGVTRAGHTTLDWSQGELRLYLKLQ